ncbi:DUF4190 domain-containing protein [Streptomyces mirabilis]|uniref:DUF4190 domain-containing protein n=1 Tax=Streptomyces mirabilis TaxID=68239 RepID=UPI0033323C72
MRRTHARRTSVPTLCFLPAVGLVLGIVALAQIRKRGERGKGPAVGGMAMSSLGLALLVLAVATGGVSDFWDGFKGGMNDSARTGTVFSLRKGDCFDEPGDSSKSVAVHVDKVPCAGRHHAEVTRHSIICMFESGDGKSGLTGSLRKDGFTLNADQFAYLQAVDTLDVALRAAPAAKHVDDDLRGYKEWATRVSVALDDEAHLLRGHLLRPLQDGPEAHRPEEDGHRTQGSGPHHHPAVERRGRGQPGQRGKRWRSGGVTRAIAGRKCLGKAHGGDR